jgi:hypothetical protein
METTSWPVFVNKRNHCSFTLIECHPEQTCAAQSNCSSSLCPSCSGFTVYLLSPTPRQGFPEHHP